MFFMNNIYTVAMNIFNLIPLSAMESKQNVITPKALNMDNPVQATGAARGRNDARNLCELRRGFVAFLEFS